MSLDSKCDLGESPIWDERTQRLYFVDINSKTIHVMNASATETSQRCVLKPCAFILGIKIREPVHMDGTQLSVVCTATFL